MVKSRETLEVEYVIGKEAAADEAGGTKRTGAIAKGVLSEARPILPKAQTSEAFKVEEGSIDHHCCRDLVPGCMRVFYQG